MTKFIPTIDEIIQEFINQWQIISSHKSKFKMIQTPFAYGENHVKGVRLHSAPVVEIYFPTDSTCFVRYASTDHSGESGEWPVSYKDRHTMEESIEEIAKICKILTEETPEIGYFFFRKQTLVFKATNQNAILYIVKKSREH